METQRIITYICKVKFFTKTNIFKNLITITLFFIFVLALFSSFNEPFHDYHNQQFELFYEDDNVIIWHSRGLKIPEPTPKRIELHGNIWLMNRKEQSKIKEDSIMWRFHENYKPTLDKYCTIH